MIFGISTLVPTIGGRYSALSNFGMVPAAVMGLDIPSCSNARKKWWSLFSFCTGRGESRRDARYDSQVFAKHGRDKVTIVSSPGVASFGAWLRTTPGRIDRQGGQRHYSGRL